jgi:hypothetical protein
MMHIKNLITTAPIPGSDNWHTAVLTIDPGSATELLQGNTGNRRLSPGAVARYAAAMRKGDWKTSPEPLIFAPNGRLMNGQTRLHAVKATGIPRKFMCVFGVEESVFSVLDRGRPRNLSEAHNVDKKTSEVAKFLAHLSQTGNASRGSVTDSDFLRALNVIRDTHRDLQDHCSATAPFFSSAGFRAGAVLRVLCGESSVFVFGLYRALILGHLDELPPAGQAAARSVLTGRWRLVGGQAGLTDSFVRSWLLFQEPGSQRTKIPVVDSLSTIAEARKEMQQVLQDAANV